MFNHLHLHTEFSLLDGLCQTKPLIEEAQRLGMTALGLTDHGSMYGAIQFYEECKKAGIKPIIGVEGYMAHASRLEKTTSESKPFHITMLAHNDAGYKNILTLVTKAHMEGFYHRPRIDKELLEKYREGITVFSGCANGEIPRLLVDGRYDEATRLAKWYIDRFGKNFFLELQEHKDVPELEPINKGLAQLHRELKIPLVATNDVHYIHQHDSSVQDVLLCIQTNATVNDEKRMRMSDPSYYLKSHEEMASLSLFKEFPEAIENTQLIADRSNIKLEFNKLHLPRFKTPDGMSADEYLKDLTWKGARERFGTVTADTKQRLEYELDVIRKTQFPNYFLVVWDIASYARKNNIFFGVRGSAAASLVLYCLRITDIDPLKYGLVFERFLNVERKEMPDIDMDFQDDRRYEVITYVAKQYGEDHVAQIATFGTLKARAALRDVGRAMGISYTEVDRVARLVTQGPRSNLQDSIEETPELKEAYEQDQTLRDLMTMALKLEGVARSVGTHAAGVVISEEPLVNYVPLQPTRGEDHGVAMTQYPMEDIAKLGLLKMDFLGLDNFTILVKAKEILKQSRGIDMDFLKIPFDHQQTFELLSSAETTGIFQLESPGMRRYIKELKPSSLNDIAAMIALYRPGPMEQIPRFIDSKHGRIATSYPHPTLENLLRETYGVIVYQDQVLLIAQAFAGYTMGEADIMRKAMGKKIPAVMRAERDKFIQGAIKKGYTEQLATQVWDLIEPFAGYAFNKAHAFSYGVITYWTAYMKALYPAEYMAAVLAVRRGVEDKVSAAVAECARLGIKVLPPDVKKSLPNFSIEEIVSPTKQKQKHLGIRFGLAAIKNVGEQAIKPIVDERIAGGEYKSLEDLCRRADLHSCNKRVLESLIKAGAFDSLGERGTLLGGAERILSLAQRHSKMKDSGQSTMFDMFGSKIDVPLPALELENSPASAEVKRAWEKELLGVFLSEHPLALMGQAISKTATAYSSQVNSEMSGKNITLVGILSEVSQRATKDKRQFITARLQDMEGGVELTVWPDVFEKTEARWKEGSVLVVKGRVRVWRDTATVSVDSAEPFNSETALSDPPNTTANNPIQGRIYEDEMADDGASDEEYESPIASIEPALAKRAVSEKPFPATQASSPVSTLQRAEVVKVQEPQAQPTKKAPAIQEVKVTPPPPKKLRRIVITLKESENEEHDTELLRSIVYGLKANPGIDTFSLRIQTLDGEIASLDLPDLTADFTSDLREKFVSLIGSDAIEVQS